MNILLVNGHPDDGELMAGGAIARWIAEGHPVHALTLTDGVWKAPGGETMRDAQDAVAEENRAAERLGHTVENLLLPAMHLSFSDDLVVEVLKRIESRKIDMIVCPWENDLHHDHEVVNPVVASASRRVGRVLMGQINYYLRDVFTPNFFVDITNTWDAKIESLECFTSQWARAGNDWYEYLDITTRYYGKMAGVERAEGFITKKYLY